MTCLVIMDVGLPIMYREVESGQRTVRTIGIDSFSISSRLAQRFSSREGVCCDVSLSLEGGWVSSSEKTKS